MAKVSDFSMNRAHDRCDPPYFFAGALSALEKVDSKVVIHVEPGKMTFIAKSDTNLGLQAFVVLKEVRCVLCISIS